MKRDKYLNGLKIDKQNSEEYFRKSVEKTEQQKFLETLLKLNPLECYNIADVACGGGTLTYHLSKRFSNSKFTMIDYLDDALTIARDINRDVNNTRFIKDNIESLNSQPDNYYDIVFCWQTLSWLDKPTEALSQLVRITKPGGYIYLSSLFNLDHDVDIYSKVYDLTRESGKNNIPFNYNTYSGKTITSWIGNKVNQINFFKFIPKTNFYYSGKGIGTYTLESNDNNKLQVSGGMLLNWAILEIHK